MEWTRSGDDLFVRLDPGEEIHASLQALADEVGFDAAAITSGIGRTRNSTYGYMDDDHVYHRVNLEGGSELVTLQGNLARRESGEAFTHLHATFSDDDLNELGAAGEGVDAEQRMACCEHGACQAHA